MEHAAHKTATKWIALMMIAALLGVALGAVLARNGVFPAQEAKAETFAELTALASTSSELESPFKTVYEEASQSIVGIKLSTQLRIANGRIINDSQYVGSGVIISDDGYVVTNYHVVTATGDTVASEIAVVYGETEFLAEYVAGDEETDIAVLKVDGLDAPAAKIGDSDQLSVGDWALVIGNPLGEQFVNTLTVGVISGQNRELASGTSNGWGRSTSTGTIPMIQTNAQVNAGNSGGGLFNIRGELVGITSRKLSGGSYYGASIEGIGFAIPINTVVSTVDALIEHGTVVHPRIGVSISDVESGNDEPSKDALPNSILVSKVEAGSPAEKAGIQPYDLIVEADGQRVRTTSELQGIVRSHQVGETVSITVYRVPGLRTLSTDEDIPEGEYITLEVELQILD